MKQEILVPIITSTAENLVSRMNEQIRMMNLMIDQLYWQYEKMTELRQEKEKYFNSRDRRVEAILGLEKRYEEKCSAVSVQEKELEEIPWYDIKTRVVKSRKLREAKEEAETIRGSLLRANHTLNSKDDYFNHLEDEIKRVHVPNYISHLSKFYGAYRTYQGYAKQFGKFTGVSAPEIDVKKIVLFEGKKGDLPIVNIDKSIPSIALELDYDKFDEEEL